MSDVTSKDRVDLSDMDRSLVKALYPEGRVEPLCRLHAPAIEHTERLVRDPTELSLPSSQDPSGPALGSLTARVQRSNRSFHQ
jgi:hypothetical protein